MSEPTNASEHARLTAELAALIGDLEADPRSAKGWIEAVCDRELLGVWNAQGYRPSEAVVTLHELSQFAKASGVSLTAFMQALDTEVAARLPTAIAPLREAPDAKHLRPLLRQAADHYETIGLPQCAAAFARELDATVMTSTSVQAASSTSPDILDRRGRS